LQLKCVCRNALGGNRLGAIPIGQDFPYKNEHFSKVSFYQADTARLKICLFYFLALTCGDYFITKKAGPN